MSGIAVLADGQPIDELSEEGPWEVSGVALGPPGMRTFGVSETPRIWPADTLRDAAELLSGRPVVKNYHSLGGQAPADDVIGEVTSTGFDESLGIVFKGEITDREIAEKVAQGYLDVSPVAGIAQEREDDEAEAFVVEEISGFRDLAVVADGASAGAEIELGAGSNPAVAALSQAALTGGGLDVDGTVQEALQRSQARTPSYAGTETSEWSAPSLADYLSGYDQLPNDVSSIDDLTSDDRSLIASKTLLGEADGETFDELAFFPVVNPSTDNLNANALRAVLSGRGSQADIPADALESARTVASRLLSDEFDTDDDETEGGAAQAPARSEAGPRPEGFRAALERELSLKTPDRCRTIKDGSKVITVAETPVAQDILGVDGTTKRDIRADPLARQAVGIEDDDTVVETTDIAEDDVARHALGLAPAAGERDDSPADAAGAVPDTSDHPEGCRCGRCVDTIDVSTDSVARQALGLEPTNPPSDGAEAAAKEEGTDTDAPGGGTSPE